MCIQWCCKLCTDKLTLLTHDLALERCYEYCMARSQDLSLKDCPKGPPELRRAFHRHPARGAQRCNDCIMVVRKKNKLLQIAQQRANIALGKEPEYVGALDLGVLEIPEDFNQYAAQQNLGPGRVDVINPNWESFSLANEHLSSHQLEREWAKRSAASDNLGPDNDGAWGVRLLQPVASTFRQHAPQRMDEEDRTRVRTTLAGEVSEGLRQHIHQHSQWDNEHDEACRSAHQQIQSEVDSTIKREDGTAVGQEASRSLHQYPPHHSESSIYKPRQISRNAHQHTEYSATPMIKREQVTSIEQEASRSAHHGQYDTTPIIKREDSKTIGQEAFPDAQHARYFGRSDTDRRKLIPVEETASQDTHRRWIHYDTSSGTLPSNRANVAKKQASPQDPHRKEIHHNPTPSTRSTSSAPAARARPWDL